MNLSVTTRRALHQINNGSRRSLTYGDFKKVDLDNSKHISPEEAEYAGIAQEDLWDVNQAMNKASDLMQDMGKYNLSGSALENLVLFTSEDLEVNDRVHGPAPKVDENDIDPFKYSHSLNAPEQFSITEAMRIKGVEREYDINRNGRLTKEEYEVALNDVNSNDNLTDFQKEIKVKILNHLRDQAGAQEKVFDILSENFDHIDSDGNQFITKEEIKAEFDKNERKYDGEPNYLLMDMARNISDIEELSNDEWGDENDGIIQG